MRIYLQSIKIDCTIELYKLNTIEIDCTSQSAFSCTLNVNFSQTKTIICLFKMSCKYFSLTEIVVWNRSPFFCEIWQTDLLHNALVEKIVYFLWRVLINEIIYFKRICTTWCELNVRFSDTWHESHTCIHLL